MTAFTRRRFLGVCAGGLFAHRLFAKDEPWTALGREYAEHFRALRPLPQISRTHPQATLAEAYAVQRAMVAHLLERDGFAGIKGALISSAAQARYGVAGPLGAVLFRSGWHAAEARPVIVTVGGHPVLELEVGFVVGLPITAPLSGIEELKSHIRALVPAIELPAAPHEWLGEATAADFVSVNVDSRHYLTGAEHDPDLDPDALPLRLTRGDAVLNEIRSGETHRGQWWSCLQEVNWAVAAGYTLQPGHLIMTGAVGPKPTGLPGTYRATFGQLGEIEFTLRDP